VHSIVASSATGNRNTFLILFFFLYYYRIPCFGRRHVNANLFFCFPVRDTYILVHASCDLLCGQHINHPRARISCMERLEVALTRQTGAADLYGAATLTSASSTSSCTADLLRRQAADLRCFINNLLNSSAQLQLESTTTIFRPRLHTQAKCYFQLNIFTASINFVDLLYMLFCSSDPSPSTCPVAWQCQHIGRQT
jgi:hypothetical protein